LGSRQPTNRTNFCGADTLPLSPRCCDIAPQILTRSAFREFWSSIRGLKEPLPPNDRLSGLAGRGFIANIGGATAHDCHPLLKLGHNAQPPRMVAGRSVESGAPMLRFTEAEQASSPEKLESRPGVEPV
jgi:hypothetical protein